MRYREREVGGVRGEIVPSRIVGSGRGTGNPETNRVDEELQMFVENANGRKEIVRNTGQHSKSDILSKTNGRFNGEPIAVSD